MRHTTIYRDEWFRGHVGSALKVIREEHPDLYCCLGIDLRECGVEPKWNWKQPLDVPFPPEKYEKAWINPANNQIQAHHNQLAMDAMTVNDAQYWYQDVASLALNYAGVYPGVKGTPIKDSDREKILLRIFYQAGIILTFKDTRPAEEKPDA